jgi:hypothetical protein
LRWRGRPRSVLLNQPIVEDRWTQPSEVDQPEPPPGTRLGENLYVTRPAETLREEPFRPIDPVELARGDSAGGPWRLEASSGKYEPGQRCLEFFLNNDDPMGAGGCGRPDEVPATSTGGITPAAPPREWCPLRATSSASPELDRRGWSCRPRAARYLAR